MLAAGTKLSRVMPETAGLVMVALVTVPSASLALTFADAAVPTRVVIDPGHDVTIGTTHLFKGEEVLRGFGAPAVKSAELLFVSVHPSVARKSAVVVLGAGAGLVSEQFAVLPYPTRSITLVPVGQVPLKAVVVLATTTLPAPAAIWVLSVASGAGRSLTPLALPLSATR
jgi:hypothetical protein